MKSEPLSIEYFSDILCIWAWITQRRIEELNAHFGDRINIRHLYVDIFGDTVTRIHSQWADKGLYEGFCTHVVDAASPYESATVDHEVWIRTQPATSANAHLAIKAVELTCSKQISIEFATLLRKSFFVDCKDIGNLEVIYQLAERHEIDTDPVKQVISEGGAMAALMHDYQLAREYQIKGSPTFVMNEGRQVLFGNVGYRVLRTNIEELLNRPESEASWC